MICENCNKQHDGSYGSGRFCSSKCARGFSTKAKRKEINKKVSEKLTKEKLIKVCPECGKEFNPYANRSGIKFCSNPCSLNNRLKRPEYRKALSKAQKKRCESIEERNRLRKIGRKGGFGNKGYTKRGIRFESNLEKKCFEHLDILGLKYEAHKIIPNSSKVSDIYLVDFDLWIEIDGIDREVKKKYLKENYEYWIHKLEIYEEHNLNYKIYKTFKEFQAGLAQLVRAPVLHAGGES